MLDAGTRIGDWIIDRPLDEGGMGAVYLCHNFLSERITAAIKVMDRQRADVSRDRFVREVEAMASLRHESVVRILGFGEAPEHRAFFIAMELVEGEPLSKRIQSGPWAWPGPREVFLKIARGLAHAHSRGIAHRDIKPQNLMIGADNSACIIDFGISVAEGRTSLTTEGMFLGTVTHMAPELFGHQSPDSIKADIYALGQVYYEVLTGHRAFSAQSAMTAEQRMVYVMASKMNCEPLDPGPYCPDALRELIRYATQPSPSARIPDMAAFVAALEAVPLEAGPGLPTPPPLPPPAPASSVATGGGAMPLLPPTAQMPLPATPAAQPPPPVVPSTGSGRRADPGIPTRSGRKAPAPQEPAAQEPAEEPEREAARGGAMDPWPAALSAPAAAPAPQEEDEPPPAAPSKPRSVLWGLGVGLAVGLPIGLVIVGLQLGWFSAAPPPPVTPAPAAPLIDSSTRVSPRAQSAPEVAPKPAATPKPSAEPAPTKKSSPPATSSERSRPTTAETSAPKSAPVADPNARMLLEVGLSGDLYSPPLMSVVEGRRSAFEACFQGAGAIGYTTTVVVRWTLDAGQLVGRPKATGGVGSLGACLERRVSDMPFDVSQSGNAELELIYKVSG